MVHDASDIPLCNRCNMITLLDSIQFKKKKIWDLHEKPNIILMSAFNNLAKKNVSRGIFLFFSTLQDFHFATSKTVFFLHFSSLGAFKGFYISCWQFKGGAWQTLWNLRWGQVKILKPAEPYICPLWNKSLKFRIWTKKQIPKTFYIAPWD